MPEKQHVQEWAQGALGIWQTKTSTAAQNKRFFNVLHNMTLLKGGLHTRPGLKRITGAQLGSGSDRTVYNFSVFPGNPDLLVTACGSTLQTVSTSGGDPSSMTDSLPSGYGAYIGAFPTSMVYINGSLHIVNNSSSNRKYNGTNITRMGLVTPSTLAAPTKAGGALTLTRNYRATLIANTLNGSGESDPTAVTSVTYAAQDGTFASPTVPSSDPQVDRWLLYGEATGVYYRVNDTPQTLATSIVDSLSDAVLATHTPMEPVGTNTPPPGNFSVLFTHQGRLVGATNSSALYYSDLGLDAGGLYPKPHAWPTSNVIQFPETGGKTITGGVSFFEWAVICQQNGIWSVKGDIADEETRTISPLMVAPDFQGLGVPNQSCLRLLDNILLVAAKDGAYIIKRNDSFGQSFLSVEPVSAHINQLWQRINFTTGAASLADRDNKRWIFIGTGGN